MKKSWTLLLDIDHTIFNTHLYRELCFKDILNKLQYEDISKGLAIADEIYQEQRNTGYFKIKFFLEKVCEKLHRSKDIEYLTKSFFDEDIIRESLYKDVEPTLHELSNRGSIRLCIFSGGQEDMQRKKIHSLVHFFDHENIHINEVDKTSDIPQIINKYKDSIIVIIDDLPEILEKYKALHPQVFTVLMQRNQSRNLTSEFKPDFLIENLNKMTTIIQ